VCPKCCGRKDTYDGLRSPVGDGGRDICREFASIQTWIYVGGRGEVFGVVSFLLEGIVIKGRFFGLSKKILGCLLGFDPPFPLHAQSPIIQA